MRLPGWFKFDVKLGQAANDEAGIEGKLALTSRTVMLVRDFEIGGKPQEMIENDANFRTSQGCANAGMRATAERHMLIGLGPF